LEEVLWQIASSLNDKVEMEKRGEEKRERRGKKRKGGGCKFIAGFGIG
jgi:hypothetical protein